MDSKLQPVQLYGFSKSRLYEPLGTAIFFRNRFCPVSWILLFLPVHFYGYSLWVTVWVSAILAKRVELFDRISAEKVLKSCDFRTLMVAGERNTDYQRYFPEILFTFITG